ncbi:MAG: hypothetical protein FWG83_07675, partial [Oscillospiraceae bacterium]|nr:hypothetical protein [Oscillospiraceae bacterium]
LYDRVGEREKAFAHHEAAKKIRPDNPAVVYNDDYFAKLRSLTPKISTEFSPQGEQSPPLGRMC